MGFGLDLGGGGGGGGGPPYIVVTLADVGDLWTPELDTSYALLNYQDNISETGDNEFDIILPSSPTDGQMVVFHMFGAAEYVECEAPDQAGDFDTGNPYFGLGGTNTHSVVIYNAAADQWRTYQN